MQDNQITDENKPIRLQAYLAHSGVASRRASELIITDGRVSVNGQIITELGTKVTNSDVVCVDGKQISKEQSKRYVLLNKPSGFVCSLSDEKDRPVAADILKPHFSERLYNVGRLDMFSSGLIIFTNDGDFASRVSHPSAEIEKEYIVQTSLPYPRELPEKFMKGIRVDGVFYKCVKAEAISRTRMNIVLVEGKNREIRRVLESFDVRVKTLTRIRIGTLTLKTPDGSIMQGEQWRELNAQEVQDLLNICKQK